MVIPYTQYYTHSYPAHPHSHSHIHTQLPTHPPCPSPPPPPNHTHACVITHSRAHTCTRFRKHAHRPPPRLTIISSNALQVFFTLSSKSLFPPPSSASSQYAQAPREMVRPVRWHFLPILVSYFQCARTERGWGG